jgi:hypothetical protein
MMPDNKYDEFSSLEIVFDDAAVEEEHLLCADDRPIPKPHQHLTPYEQILQDPSLAKLMHSPDYFLLVE